MNSLSIFQLKTVLDAMDNLALGLVRGEFYYRTITSALKGTEYIATNRGHYLLRMDGVRIYKDQLKTMLIKQQLDEELE